MKWEDTEDSWYSQMLIGLTVAFYAASLTGTVLLYVYFTRPECGLNTFFVTFNLILCLAQSAISVIPKVQEVTPRSGLFQGSVLCLYTTYLVASALISMPNGDSLDPSVPKCGFDRSDASQSSPISQVMVYAGLVITFVALGYSAFSSGSTSAFEVVVDSPFDAETGDDGQPEDDEKERTKYNYSLFHFVFIMAAFYMSMVLTDWSIMQSDPSGQVKIVHGYGAMWVKIATSWLCIVLYVWTLVSFVSKRYLFDFEKHPNTYDTFKVAPFVMPDRDFST
jgi:hypothetical protein